MRFDDIWLATDINFEDPLDQIKSIWVQIPPHKRTVVVDQDVRRRFFRVNLPYNIFRIRVRQDHFYDLLYFWSPEKIDRLDQTLYSPGLPNFDCGAVCFGETNMDIKIKDDETAVNEVLSRYWNSAFTNTGVGWLNLYCNAHFGNIYIQNDTASYDLFAYFEHWQANCIADIPRPTITGLQSAYSIRYSIRYFTSDKTDQRTFQTRLAG